MTEHFRKLENMYLSAPLNNQVYSEVAINITEGKAEISQLIQEKFFHAAGSLHGSVYFKLLDDSAYFAANSLVIDYFLYTTSFQIQILKPLKEGIIRAEGVVIKPGASVIIAESRLYDQRNKLAAIGQGQFMKSTITFLEIEGYKT